MSDLQNKILISVESFLWMNGNGDGNNGLLSLYFTLHDRFNNFTFSAI